MKSVATGVDGNEFNAIMRIWDLHGYLYFWAFTFIGLEVFAFIIDGAGSIQEWYVHLLFALFTVCLTVSLWFVFWLVFGLFGIAAAKTKVSETGVYVQNAYSASAEIDWSDITAVQTVAVPFFSQYIYLQTKSGIIYCMGRHYREQSRFLNALDRSVPSDHPLRTQYLG